MRFLLDENMPAAAGHALREAGHDVVTVQDTDPGLADQEVVAMARRDGRVLVSFDSDIGERLFLHGDLPPVGVVYLRLTQTSADEAARVVLSLLRGGGTLNGFYTTYRNGVFRQSPLPPVS